MKKKTFIRTLSLHALSLLLALAACQNENDNLPSAPDTDPAAGGSLRLTTPVVTLDATADALNPSARTRGAGNRGESTRGAGTRASGTVDFSAMTLQIRLVKADHSDYLQEEASYTYTAPADGSTTDGTWSLTSSAPAVSAPGKYRLRALAHLTRADGLPMLAYFDDLSTISTDGNTTRSDGTTPAHFTLALQPAAAQLCLRLKDANGRIITDGSTGTNPNAAADAATFASLMPNAAALQHALLPAAITNDTWPTTEDTALPLSSTAYVSSANDASDPIRRNSPVYLPGDNARYFVLSDVYPGGAPGNSGPGITPGTTLFSLTHLGKTYNIVLPSATANGKGLTLAAGTRTTLTVSLGATDATVEEITIADMEDASTSIDLNPNNSGICPIGTGSNGQPAYVVANAQGLQAFADLVLGTTDTPPNPALNCLLMEDIHLPVPTDLTNGSNWTAIGTNDHPYTGTFDGGGHTVSGLVINQSTSDYQGFFGIIGTNDKPDTPATVKNLTVTGKITNSSGSNPHIGGIVGYSLLGSSIENCISRVKITSTNSRATIGGVVGFSTDTISNCSNTGSITSASSETGGVTGYNSGTVSHCSNTGKVTSTSSATGGVTGSNSGTVSHCNNTGKVTSTSSATGGVTGSNSGTVSHCSNTGKVTGTSSGGVTGVNRSTIIACYNIGNVSGGSNVGGVVGYNYQTVIACYSTGSVSGGSSVGGVLGYHFYALPTTCFWQSINNQPSNGIGTTYPSAPGTDTGATNITNFGTPGTGTLKKKWGMACGEYQSSSDGTLNKAIYDWNADKIGNKANQFCPYRYAENPEYNNDDAEAAAAAGESYAVAPLILVPITQ